MTAAPMLVVHWRALATGATGHGLAEQARRIASIKTGLLISGVVLGLLAAGAGALYLAVRLVRLAWGAS